MSFRGYSKCGCPIYDEGCIHDSGCRNNPRNWVSLKVSDKPTPAQEVKEKQQQPEEGSQNPVDP
jgi:hypothetical protein